MSATLSARRVLCAAAALLSALTATAGLAQTKVAIGTAKDPNLAAEIAIAQAKGYFKDAGLDASIQYFPSGGDLMAAFVGGSIQFGSAGSTPVLILRSRPYPLVAVAQMSDISGAQQLITKPSVQSLQDLKGKTIGLLAGTASEAFFNAAIAEQGLAQSDFKIVNLGPAEMLQAFVRGDADAVALWEPHTTRARAAGSGKTLVSGTHSYYGGKEKANRIYGDHALLFTTQAYLEKDPATVQAVVKALARAAEFIDKEHDEAIRILAGQFSLTAEQMSDIAKVNAYTLRLDDTLAADLDKVAGFLQQHGKLKQIEPAADWIDAGPLKAVDPDLVQLR